MKTDEGFFYHNYINSDGNARWLFEYADYCINRDSLFSFIDAYSLVNGYHFKKVM